MAPSGAQPPKRLMRQVLIIDDSDPDLLYSRLTVERARIAELVVTFGTAQEALDYLQRADAPPVDAILLDINMPETNGFAFLECFEVFRPERRHSAVVVMLTSSPDPHDRERAQSFASVKGYITKPIDAESARKLVAVINGASGW